MLNILVEVVGCADILVEVVSLFSKEDPIGSFEVSKWFQVVLRTSFADNLKIEC